MVLSKEAPSTAGSKAHVGRLLNIFKAAGEKRQKRYGSAPRAAQPEELVCCKETWEDFGGVWLMDEHENELSPGTIIDYLGIGINAAHVRFSVSTAPPACAALPPLCTTCAALPAPSARTCDCSRGPSLSVPPSRAAGHWFKCVKPRPHIWRGRM